MKKLWILAVLLCLLCGNYLPSTARSPRREVAFTVDDLPTAEDAGAIKEMQAVTRKLLASLVANRVPAIGFVNESRLYVKGGTDARIDVLRMWTDAGMILGNHTFSHADFNKVSLPEYEDELIRGEVVTRKLMQEKGFNKLYFRYPYNHTGPTREAKETFQRFLESRGYEIAPFTVENEDYIFASVYRKAKQAKDEPFARRIRAAYLDYLDTKFAYYEERSRVLLGREIKQIYLMHVNEINADSISEMIQRLKQRGYSFITIEQALKDDAYRLKDEYVGDAGISWLHRWMLALGKKLDYRDDPDPPKFILDLYRAK